MSESTDLGSDSVQEAAADATIAAATSVGSSASTPATSDIASIAKEIEDRLRQEQDKRMGAFQSQLSERDQALAEAQNKLREYQVAGMSEDERQALQQQERDEELDNLRLRNQLYELQEKYPLAAPVYRRLIEAGPVEEQIRILADALTPKQEGAIAAPVVPDVDPNNPQNRLPADSIVTEGGVVMNEQIADQTLRSLSRWPGQG